ncbi:unnamed protein product [Rotaria sordida]|uniref:Uncharacterized protein n=2 Tax=Rotaria sordida TaxID=392033 RepID=A0A815FS60_9BILA|nr:unnamed protein product [Rotaria sordida]
MATTTTNRNLCETCRKVKGVSKCEGCSKTFCYNHFVDHRQQLNKQLDEVEVTRDLFRQTLSEQTSESQNHILLQQINDWERNSIDKIRQTADEARKLLLKYTAKHITGIEIELNKLTDQLRQNRQDNDFIETDLFRWINQLIQLTDELNKLSKMTIRQSSRSLINKIYVDISIISSCWMEINANTRWLQNGICIDDDEQMIYIAGTSNHRILEWKYGATNGRIVAGGNGPRDRVDQLNNPKDVVVDKENNCLIICDEGNKRVMLWPRRNGTNGQIISSNVRCAGLAMDDDGCFYVSDCKIHEVRRWRIGDNCGTVVAGGNGRGNHLNQLNCPSYIFVDQYYSVYISDEKNYRVMKWIRGATEGIVVAGGQGKGNGLAQLSCPRGVIVDQLGTVYVVDCENNRIMRWSKEAKEGTVVVGGNNQGKQLNQFYHPEDLSFDREGNIYVVDCSNDRIQRFNIDLTSS